MEEISETSKPKQIPIGAHYLRVKNFYAKDANSVILNFYQIGPNSCHAQILLDLLEMIAEEPIYNILRNKEQLAYSNSFNLHNDLGILGYSISVKSQETKFTVDYVDERIENFRRELLAIIEQMSVNDFDTFKRSLAKNKWIEYDKRVDGYQWNWGSDEGIFDSVHENVEYLITITKEQLLEFYLGHLDTANQRKLSIQVIGNAQAEEIDSDSDDIIGSFDELTYVNFTGEPKGFLITDLMEFRNRLEEYKLNEKQECYQEYSTNSVNTKIIRHLDVRAVCCYFLLYICNYFLN